jgi:hypothetical protein
MDRISRGVVLAVTATALWPATFAEAGNCRNFDGFNGRPQLRVIALTSDQALVRFKECKPGKAKVVGSISGLTGSDTALVGIDYRVQDGLLYGVGNGGGIYTIDGESGAATAVSTLTVALDGTSFGVDFNPAADRLRIISDTGQNLRHNVNAGGTTTADALLNYAAVTASGITGAAYTNNDRDADTGTTLFDVDSSLDQVVLQSPPNNGTLVATGKLTVDTDTAVGFDVYTRLDDDQQAAHNRAYASLSSGGTTQFYRVSLLTGAATSLGELDHGVIDIAIPLDQ